MRKDHSFGNMVSLSKESTCKHVLNLPGVLKVELPMTDHNMRGEGWVGVGASGECAKRMYYFLRLDICQGGEGRRTIGANHK